MRFEVEKRGSTQDSYYAIIDTEFDQWNMPKQAVSLFFATYEQADQVRQLLEREWRRFLSNPR